MLSLLWQICMILGKFTLLKITKYWANNLDIWSHCSQSVFAFGLSFFSLFFFFYLWRFYSTSFHVLLSFQNDSNWGTKCLQKWRKNGIQTWDHKCQRQPLNHLCSYLHLCLKLLGTRDEARKPRLKHTHLSIIKNVRFVHCSCGCGAVGRVAAYNTNDPQFKSSHWQIYLPSAVLKRPKSKKKRPGMAQFLKDSCLAYTYKLWPKLDFLNSKFCRYAFTCLGTNELSNQDK